MCVLGTGRSGHTEPSPFSCSHCVKRYCEEPDPSRGGSRRAGLLAEGGAERGSIGREESPPDSPQRQEASPLRSNHTMGHPSPREEAQAPSHPLSRGNISLPRLLLIEPSYCATPRPLLAVGGRCRLLSHSIKPVTSPPAPGAFCLFLYEVDSILRKDILGVITVCCPPLKAA